MKFILTLLLMGIIHCGYSQNKTDILLKEASSAYNQEEYQNSLLILKQIEAKGKSREYIDRLTIMNYRSLLTAEGYPSFSSINQLIERSEIFIKRYPKSKWIAEIVEISRELNAYPRTVSAYEKIRLEEEQRRLKSKQDNLLNAISISYQNGNYDESLKGIQSARAAGYYSSQVQFYDLFSRYYKFKEAPIRGYKDIEELRSLLGALKKNSDSTLGQQELQSVAELYLKLPKSQDEFRKEEEARLLEVKLAEIKKKFNSIEDRYKSSDYTKVIDAVNDFPEKSDEQLKVTYYQAMSKYRILVANKTYTFNDVSEVKTTFQEYITKYQSRNLSLKNDINNALIDLNARYPKTEGAFNAIVNKQKRASLALIRKANRRTFTSIGYEYGELAPYGLRFETGGHFIGLFTTLRYGMKTEDELRTHYYAFGSSQPNKTEILLGPNFKLAKWLFLNIGGGYGMYSYLSLYDYANELGVSMTGYVAGYSGITVRAGNVVNLVGGASFMDVDKQLSRGQFSTPEFTVGITFNLK